MQGNELKEIRERLGLERLAFARLLGYTGTDRNDEMRIRRYENQSDKYQLPLYIARLAWLISKVEHLKKADADELLHETSILSPEEPIEGLFPFWPGYEFDHEPDPAHAK